MDISQMNQAMGSTPPPVQPTGTMTVQQMQNIMNSGKMTPDTSAAALGHSNTMLSGFLGATGSAFNAVAGAEKEFSTGFAKGELSTAQGIGNLIAKPVNALLSKVGAGTDPSKIGIPQEQLAPQGMAQKVGSVAETGAELLTPVGGEGMVGKLLSKGEDLPVVGKLLSKAGEYLTKKPVESAVEKQVTKLSPVNVSTKRLASTAETLTKGEREAAIKEGRMTTSGKYLPSKTEQRAGEIMKGKTYSNPVKTTKAIQGEIATRGQAAETHLEQNVKPISNKEDFDAFQKARASSEKYMTPSEASAYDEQIGVFQKVLKGYTGEGGYTTANYYKALKDYESQVTANLAKGKDALLTPGGAARIQGAKDVRQVVRDMIGEKNPEFKGEMYDLASLYDSLDNVVAKAEQGGHSLVKRYPRTATAIGTTATFLGAEEIKKDIFGN